MSDSPDVSSQPLQSKPVSPNSRFLQQKYFESVAAQSNLMDKLSYQLITIELAIPGLYTAVLKLTQGDKAIVQVDNWLIATFGFWLLALALTLWAILPKEYKVNPNDISKDSQKPEQGISIQEFFKLSAQYKRRRLIGAIISFWLGIFSSIFVLF